MPGLRTFAVVAVLVALGSAAPCVASARLGDGPAASPGARDENTAVIASRRLTHAVIARALQAASDSRVSGASLGGGVIAAIVIGVVAFIICHIFLFWGVYVYFRNRFRRHCEIPESPKMWESDAEAALAPRKLDSSTPGDNRQTADVIAVAISELKRELQVEQLQIHDLIARGGFGAVYRGTWRRLSVAVKTVVFQGVNIEDASMQRAVAEASIAYNLDHPNIVATYSHELKPLGENAHAELASWKLYLIQELCNGGTLRDLVSSKALLTERGGVHFARVLSLLLDIAQGMAHVHAKRICHGDLTPSNILLHVSDPEESESWRLAPSAVSQALKDHRCTAKVTDFGLSSRLDTNMTHVSNVKQGTPYYCAPELVRQGRLLAESDVYSFGVIAWGLVHSCAPYVVRNGVVERHPHFPAFQHYVPLNYALLAIACMSTDPAQRPSFVQIGDVLDSVCQEMASGQYVDALGQVQEQEYIETQAPPAARPSDEDAFRALTATAGSITAGSITAAFKTAAMPNNTVDSLRATPNDAGAAADGVADAKPATAGWCSVDDIFSSASTLAIVSGPKVGSESDGDKALWAQDTGLGASNVRPTLLSSAGGVASLAASSQSGTVSGEPSMEPENFYQQTRARWPRGPPATVDASAAEPTAEPVAKPATEGTSGKDPFHTAQELSAAGAPGAVLPWQ